MKRTETVSNSTHPEWNEELQFIVDDPDAQSVSVIVKDDDAFNDTVSALCLPMPCPRTTTPHQLLPNGLKCAMMSTSRVIVQRLHFSACIVELLVPYHIDLVWVSTMLK